MSVSMSGSSDDSSSGSAVTSHRNTWLEVAQLSLELAAQLASSSASSASRSVPPYMTPLPPGLEELQGLQWVQTVLRNESHCYDLFRMPPAAFQCLHDTLFERHGLVSTRECNSLECLGMYLWTVGHGMHYRDTRLRFGRSLDTVSRKFRLANDAMYSFAQDVICPTGAYSNARHPRLNRYMPYLDGCVGAIDGVHVPVVVAREVHDEWINRKGFTSQNVLAICDHDERFIYVGAGMKGACHDMAVLKECEQRHGFPHPPEGKFYVADAGYKLDDKYLTPFRKERYHLRVFERSVPQGMKETYNFHHARIRNVIERCFGQLKEKWKILLLVPEYDIETQSRVIVSCFGLHNFVKDFNRWVHRRPLQVPNAQPLSDEWIQLNAGSEMKAVRNAIAIGVWSVYAPADGRVD